MRQVIKSEAEPGDGVSIEREQPSTAFRSMPAYGALHSSFKAQPIDELTGTFDAQMGELRSDHLTFKAQPINELTGEGRPMNVWTNGSATSFEDRVFYGIDPDIQRPTHPNDNIGTNSDSYFGDEIHFFTPVASQNGTATFAGSFNLEKGDLPHEGEIFQPARGMNSFGESLNPVSELGGTAGPGATSFMTGRENFDVVAHGVMAGKLNFDVVVH